MTGILVVTARDIERVGVPLSPKCAVTVPFSIAVGWTR